MTKTSPPLIPQKDAPDINTSFKHFQSEEWQVRTLIRNGELWFKAKDICSALDLSDTNKALLTLDDDEKCEHEDYSGSGRKPWLINESGLYRLVFCSRKKPAERFRKWVTSKVLPSIRETGSYSAPLGVFPGNLNLPAIPETFVDAIQALAEVTADRDIAIADRNAERRSKGQISSSREASVMGKYSAVVRKNRRLRDRLGEGDNWKTVEFISWVKELFPDEDIKKARRAVGIRLTEWCKKHDCQIRKVPNNRYDLVNAYRAEDIKKYYDSLKHTPSESVEYARLLETNN